MEIGDWSRKIGEWSLGAGRFLDLRRGVADRRRGFREELLDATCNCLSIVRFAHGPKRSIGNLLRGEKILFLDSRYLRSRPDGRVDGILSIAARRSLWGRLGSVLDVGKRLRRMRWRCHQWVAKQHYCARGATGPRAARARSPASGRATGRAARKKRGAYWCAGAAAP